MRCVAMSKIHSKLSTRKSLETAHILANLKLCQESARHFLSVGAGFGFHSVKPFRLQHGAFFGLFS